MEWYEYTKIMSYAQTVIRQYTEHILAHRGATQEWADNDQTVKEYEKEMDETQAKMDAGEVYGCPWCYEEILPGSEDSDPNGNHAPEDCPHRNHKKHPVNR